MKQTVNLYQFEQAFNDMDRGNQFTRKGLIALFDYLTELEDDCDTEVELDVIALCCDFNEYENLKEFQDNYGTEYQTIDDIEHSTSVIRFDGGFIIQAF